MSGCQTKLGIPWDTPKNPKQKSSALVGKPMDFRTPQHLTDKDGTYFPLPGLVDAGDGLKDP